VIPQKLRENQKKEDLKTSQAHTATQLEFKLKKTSTSVNVLLVHGPPLSDPSCQPELEEVVPHAIVSLTSQRRTCHEAQAMRIDPDGSRLLILKKNSWLMQFSSTVVALSQRLICQMSTVKTIPMNGTPTRQSPKCKNVQKTPLSCKQ
jgi:hypothetical protein